MRVFGFSGAGSVDFIGFFGSRLQKQGVLQEEIHQFAKIPMVFELGRARLGIGTSACGENGLTFAVWFMYGNPLVFAPNIIRTWKAKGKRVLIFSCRMAFTRIERYHAAGAE